MLECKDKEMEGGSMLTLEFVRAFIGEKMFARGMQEYTEANVFNMEITENDEHYKLITANVQGEEYYSIHVVNIELSPQNEWITKMSCDCEYFDYRHTPCKHIAAVLIAYVKRDEIQPEPSLRKKHTDKSFKEFLSSYQAHTSNFLERPLNIILEPEISPKFRNDMLEVGFKIGLLNEHLYSIQNITEFVENLDGEKSKKYGKSLEFTHTLQAFHPRYRPLVQYLVDYVHDETSYSLYQSIPGYRMMYAGDLPRRTITVKSYAIDIFWDTIQNLPFNIKENYGILQPYTLVDGRPSMSASIEKVDDGYQFNTTVLPYITGKKYSYFFDESRQMIYRDVRTSQSFRKLIDYFHSSKSENIFIGEDDIAVFAKNVFPILQKNLTVQTEGFNPTQYLPEVPGFEIYLDMPQDNLITGELFAIYSHGKYNVLLPKENAVNRDLSTEKNMDQFFSPWFSAYDPANSRMVLSDDDDKVYRFVKFGILEMQAKADVFISESLKKLKIHSQTRISIGVSVNHDLLQLNLVSDQINLKQLNEILSKYDPKKKYYRLKSGEFVDIDDNIQALASFKDAMNLSTAQFTRGSIDVPAYRASYLDQLSKTSILDIQAEENFRKLIRNMRDIEEIEYTIPQEIEPILRPYQKKGFRWLYALKENHLGGLLADEMGLGKSIQIISLLAAWKDRKRTLIVCPSSLVYNWANEINKFMPNMHYTMISGFANIRKELIRTSLENDILITSYDALKRDIDIYRTMEFSCQVIDEAQYIKNASTLAAQSVKAINSRFRIALTGTPIENRLSELWSIFDFILPGFFGSYQKFRTNYELPIVRDQDEFLEAELQKMVTPFILRRRKKDVLHDLPDKIEDVYYGKLEDEQKDLYEARVQRFKLMLQKQSDEEFKENKIAVLVELTRLRQLCCDPHLIYDHYKGNSAKKELCLDIVENAIEEGHKILLFSQFTSMLDTLTEEFDKKGIRYHKLVGSTPQRERAQMVESFQKDDVPIFCISLKAGGTGLNLTAADIVIHYDPWWNTAVENQASDRAHRIGQTNVVNVFRLIIKDTIEERIIQLQKEKSSLADRILSGEGVSSATLSRQDLLELL